MGDKLKLPVGIDDFEKIRRNILYYIDKDKKLIEQLFVNWGEVPGKSTPFWKDAQYEYA